MARPVSGKIRTSFMRQKQKNGDIYVFERQTLYDPEKKYTRNLSYKLIGKIKPGTTEIIPTRPKRKSKKEAAAAEGMEPAQKEMQEAPGGDAPIAQALPAEELFLAEPPAQKASAKKDPMNIDDGKAAGRDGTQDEAADFPDEETAMTTPGVQHIGASDILAWIGEQSGIDDDLLIAFGRDKASKLSTIARWQLSSGGSHLSRIPCWQRTHSTPCDDCLITRETYHELFKELAREEDLQHLYFILRADRCDMSETALADFRTSPSYAGRSISSRLGCCCDGALNDVPFDELDTDLYSGFQTASLLVSYSVKSRQPVAFIRRKEQIIEQYSVQQAAQQLEQSLRAGGRAHGVPLVVTNSVFYSDAAAAFYVQNNIDFLGLVNVDLEWVQQQLKAHQNDVKEISPFNPLFCGCTVKIEYVIEHDKGNRLLEKKIVPMYLYIYRDLEREAIIAESFAERIAKISANVKNGGQDFTDEESYILRDLLVVTKDKDDRIIEVKKDAEKLNEAAKRCSLFCLLSNKKMDPFYTLHCYQAREYLEEIFDIQNDAADEMHHIQTDDEYSGRLFAQFVSAGYWLYFNEAVKKVLARLREETSAAKSQGGKDYALKEELLDWLSQQSLVDVLDWFDAVGQIELHVPQAGISVQTKSSPRDQLFIKMLKETASASGARPGL